MLHATKTACCTALISVNGRLGMMLPRIGKPLRTRPAFLAMHCFHPDTFSLDILSTMADGLWTEHSKKLVPSLPLDIRLPLVPKANERFAQRQDFQSPDFGDKDRQGAWVGALRLPAFLSWTCSCPSWQDRELEKRLENAERALKSAEARAGGKLSHKYRSAVAVILRGQASASAGAADKQSAQ